VAKYTRTLYEAWEEDEELGGIGWHRSGSLGLARDADTLLQVLKVFDGAEEGSAREA
jgi:hypothetical protein